MPLELPELRTTASEAGFHFADLFANCAWKFFLRMVLRLEPTTKSLALVNGAAFHYGKAVFYVTQSEGEALEGAAASVATMAGELEPGIEVDAVVKRVQAMLAAWIRDRGLLDLREYEIEGVEQTFRIPVPGLTGFYFTGRIDARLRSRTTRLLEIRESKTAGNSIRLTMDALELGDQVTSYYWGEEHLTGEAPWGVVGDVTYWNKSTQDESKIQNALTPPLTRSKYDVEQFKLATAQRFSEIAQKVSGIESGKDPRALFGANRHYCTAYGRRCEYADVCRDSRILRGYVPPGFRKEEPVPIQRIGEETWDSSLLS